MKVVIFGASGLIGDGILQECLQADDVSEVVTVGRSPLDAHHPKLRSVVHGNFLDFSPIVDEVAGADACFWALGVSSVGMSPEDYERVTYEFTIAAARTLVAVNPALTFVYLSGAGTDSTEHGRSRWARVKGRTENAVIATFTNGYALRPGLVLPAHHMRPRPWFLRALATGITPVAPVLQRWFPGFTTNTEQIGRTALQLARRGHSRHVLENRDIVTVATASVL